MQIELGADQRGRREAGRLANDLGPAILRSPDQQLEGEVADESLGGLAIQFPGDVSLPLGQEVEVQYGGQNSWAIVCHLEPHDNGCRIGLEWKACRLAAAARAATFSEAPEQRKLPARILRFVEMVPGGLHTMWRLLEREDWERLGEAADRFGREAQSCGFSNLAPTLKRLDELLASGQPQATVKTQLERLCVQAIRLVDNSMQVQSGERRKR